VRTNRTKHASDNSALSPRSHPEAARDSAMLQTQPEPALRGLPSVIGASAPASSAARDASVTGELASAAASGASTGGAGSPLSPAPPASVAASSGGSGTRASGAGSGPSSLTMHASSSLSGPQLNEIASSYSEYGGPATASL
jgi:hypothetical protein